jgi:hypothetical protein
LRQIRISTQELRHFFVTLEDCLKDWIHSLPRIFINMSLPNRRLYASIHRFLQPVLIVSLRFLLRIKMSVARQCAGTLKTFLH